MRRAYLLAVLTVSLALSFAAPSTAAAVKISLEPAQQTSATAALLKGKVTSRTAVSTVTIEEEAGYRWRTVQTVSVDSTGAFQATVPATVTAVWYRARTGRYTSQKVVVQAAAVEPEPEPESPVSTPDDACGPQFTKADGTPWVCTLAEDFEGTDLNRSLWVPQTIFATGSVAAWACYLDDPSVISVHDGALHLGVRKLDEPMLCPGNQDQPTSYAAGMVSTYRLFSQQFGRFEARVKNSATTAPGLHEAFWLWPMTATALTAGLQPGRSTFLRRTAATPTCLSRSCTTRATTTGVPTRA